MSRQVIVRSYYDWRRAIRVQRSLSTEPDPSWKYVDRQGHVHRWDGDSLPSLLLAHTCPPRCLARQRVAAALRRLGFHYRHYCDHPTHFVCAACLATVEPARREVIRIKTGRSEFLATVEIVSETRPIWQLGDRVRLETFFPELRGEAIVQDERGAFDFRDTSDGDPRYTLELLGVGTIELLPAERDRWEFGLAGATYTTSRQVPPIVRKEGWRP